MKIFTIGFTKKSAKAFFSMLKKAGVNRIVDIRLNTSSQLAGFAKKDDLRYFLSVICRIEYIHIPEFAPTKEILDEYRKNKGDWDTYVKQYNELLEIRNAEKVINKTIQNSDCLLCSEDEPQFCHRRLLAEYIFNIKEGVEIVHIRSSKLLFTT